MSDSGFSLVDLNGISEPLTKFIDSVSRGIGAIYEPTGKVRNAKAESKAMLILAEAKSKSNEITARAIERVNHKEIRRQNNIDAIVAGAAENLPIEVDSEEVDEDWIVSFFNYAQDIGNPELQQIWSKLLAGEVASPGSFSPRTLQAVKSLTKEEARLFTLLCSFSFKTSNGDRVLPIFSSAFFDFIRDNGLEADDEIHLKNIGLLSSNEIYYSDSDTFDSEVIANYFSDEYVVCSEPDGDGYMLFGGFPFTEIGEELATIAGAEPNESYIKTLLRSEDIRKTT
jgi:hypothetical protein